MRRLSSHLCLAGLALFVLIGPGLTVLNGQSIPMHTKDVYATYSTHTLMNPAGITADVTTGVIVLYIGDMHNHVIERFDGTSFQIVAGSGVAGYADGSLTSAQFDHPTGLSGGTHKWLYQYQCPPPARIGTKCTTWYYYTELLVADAKNATVRLLCSGNSTGGFGLCRSSNSNSVTTVAGNHTSGFANGPSLSASFAGPTSTYGSYVVDTSNHAIRLWSGGNVSTFAGTGFPGLVDGYRTSAQFSHPSKVAQDANGNLYVADTGNHCIRKIDPSGNVTTFAGNGQPGYANGSGTNAAFSSPSGIIFNSADSFLYVADSTNNVIRRLDLSANVTTYAGTGQAGFINGSLSQSSFQRPSDLVIIGSWMFVTDTMNNAIRRIDRVNGIVSTYLN